MTSTNYPITRSDLVLNCRTGSYFVGDYMLVPCQTAHFSIARFDVFEQVDGDEFRVAKRLTKGAAIEFINSERVF